MFPNKGNLFFSNKGKLLVHNKGNLFFSNKGSLFVHNKGNLAIHLFPNKGNLEQLVYPPIRAACLSLNKGNLSVPQ